MTILMQMTMRWFGAEKDTVTLEQIRQVPGVTGVVPALHDLPAGEAWPLDRILKMKAEIEAAGLTMECIESVNVHEDIKLGAPSAERYIENYKTSIRNLAKAGVKVICYNFMPIFDWTRTDLAMRMGDGATCLSYDGAQIEGKSPEDMFREIDENSNGYAMPGWETERMGEIKDLFQKYKGVTDEDLWRNLQHFLEEIIPVCEACDVKMAIHPDDPPWGIFGLPRIIELYFVLAVIAQFEIGFVEKLIALDVIKQAQVVVAVHLIIPIVLIKLGHIRFQLFPDRVCKRIEICIVGVKGAAIELCLFDDFGHRNGG